MTDLIRLGRFVGDPVNDLCILAEGNVSARIDDKRFWVKASGCSLANCDEGDFVRVDIAPLLLALGEPTGDTTAVRTLLNLARCDDVGQIPSTEAFMHAALLNMPGVRFVAHGHPQALLSILCLENAEEYSAKRLFPDEIVCCGPAACYVRYVAPGIELAKEIVLAAAAFRSKHGIEPKTYWLQNHGLIAVGETVGEVEAALQMSVKAARVLLGALSSGRPLRWLNDDEIAAIFNWPDEHYRQAKLRDAP